MKVLFFKKNKNKKRTKVVHTPFRTYSYKIKVEFDKEEKIKQEMIEKEISRLKEDIETQIRCMQKPEWYKLEHETMEEFLARGNKGIENLKNDILRLQAGDFELCEQHMDRRYNY